MIRLGIDLGSVRIGLAKCDALGMIASPLKVILRRDDGSYLSEIADLIRELEVREVVVGLPRNMNGTYGEAAESVKSFIGELEKIIDIPIVTWDERLSTAQVSRMLIEADISRKKRKQVVDKSAAALILQGYLDRMG